MSDNWAVAHWCLIQALEAAPLVGAYYLGRWTQRREQRHRLKETK